VVSHNILIRKTNQKPVRTSPNQALWFKLYYNIPLFNRFLTTLKTYFLVQNWQSYKQFKDMWCYNLTITCVTWPFHINHHHQLRFCTYSKLIKLAMSSATQYELVAWPHPSSTIATSPGHHPLLAPLLVYINDSEVRSQSFLGRSWRSGPHSKANKDHFRYQVLSRRLVQSSSC